jgi:hypothetical protein
VAGVVVDLELRSFPAPRKVDWLLDARPGGTLDVTPEWRTYTIALGDVGPGEHMLTIAVGQPAISADEILHNTDDRRLAVALGRWTIAGPGPSRAPSPP